MSDVEQFLSLFQGSNTGYGKTIIGNKRRNGKQEAKCQTVRESLTVEVMTEHLEGKTSVGAIPIDENNNCKFGAIDVDDYPIDHGELVRKVKKFKLPLAVCRSKSGGAHLYMFFVEWFPASEIREYLTEIAALLGHSGCEVFPKQDKILSDRGDLGNFINLPYFDEQNTLRYMVNEKGQAISLKGFLRWTGKNKVRLTDLDNLLARPEQMPFADAPPCLECMLNDGIPEGCRNTTMFQTGVYLRKKFPEGWQKEMEAVNQTTFNPPLPAIEVVQIQEQHEKKSYGYLCTQEPFKSYCNGENEKPQISGLTILLSEPRLYFLDVDGQRLEISTEQLQIQLQFQRQCMEQLNYMPPAQKANEWQTLVNDLLQNATQIEVPEELTLGGQFKELVKQFCTSRIRAMSPEEMEMGRPWTDKNKTYFKLKGLQDYLVNQGFSKLNRPQIQQRLKDLGGDFHGVYRYKDDSDKWKGVRVWWVPEFEYEEIKLPEGENYEAPF